MESILTEREFAEMAFELFPLLWEGGVKETFIFNDKGDAVIKATYQRTWTGQDFFSFTYKNRPFCVWGDTDKRMLESFVKSLKVDLVTLADGRKRYFVRGAIEGFKKNVDADKIHLYNHTPVAKVEKFRN